MVSLCLYSFKAGHVDACIHPLPCPLHHVTRTPVTIPLVGWEWLVEPSGQPEDGKLVVTLFGPVGQWRGSRLVPPADAEEMDRAKEDMLRCARLLNRPIARVEL